MVLDINVHSISNCHFSFQSQGKTLDAAITDLVPVNEKKADASFAYVPLTRVRRLEDIVILRPFDISILQKKKSADHRAQDKRFDLM